jgi:hypothetical protein
MATDGKRRPHRHYSDEDRANALVLLEANAGNVWRTALQLKVPYHTLREWHKADLAGTSNAKRTPLADSFEQLAFAALELAWEKMDTASFAQLVLAACQATDKCQLLRGKATARTEVKFPEMTDEQLRAAIEAEAREIARLESGVAPALPEPAGPGDGDPGEGEPRAEPGGQQSEVCSPWPPT